MHASSRRLAAVALSTVLGTGAALVAPAAQAAPAHRLNLQADSASDWLARQLTHGLVHNRQFTFDDYGLSLDVFFALKTLGTHRAASTSVLRAIDDDPEAYISFAGAHYAGATGKLATAVELQGRNPASYGGVDLVHRVESLVHTGADAQRGRGVDSGPTDFGNTIGQAWVVRALEGADSPLADEATGFLLKQQCDAGFFRENFEATTSASTFRCDAAVPAETGSVDSTALAVQALVAARANGQRGLTGEIRKASAWLARQQAANGSFKGNGVANTNTTGLAAAALALTGRSHRAQRAGAWISHRQVSHVVAHKAHKLRRETGAIAYSSAALRAGRTDGIPVDQRDQWRRATTQAAIGVAAVRRLSVATPRHRVATGSRVRLRISGLASRERWSARLGDLRSHRGTATARGRAVTSFTMPRHKRTIRVRVTGASSQRMAVIVLRVR
jgi:hypothetical protein